MLLEPSDHACILGEYHEFVFTFKTKPKVSVFASGWPNATLTYRTVFDAIDKK